MSQELALLALIHAAAGRVRLAHALSSGADPERLCRDPAWGVAPRHWREAVRQQAALAMMGITLLPLWRLPEGIRRPRDPPAALFLRGAGSWQVRPRPGLLGARRASPPAVEWGEARGPAAARWGGAGGCGGALGLRAGGP